MSLSSYIRKKDRKPEKTDSTERQKDKKTDSTERQKDRNTERQKDRKTERQKERKTERFWTFFILKFFLKFLDIFQLGTYLKIL